MIRPSSDLAVVFDCDGTLVDTEPLAWTVLSSVLRSLGHAAEDAAREACIGRSEPDCYALLTAEGSLPPAEEFWRRCRHEMTRIIAGQGLRPFGDIPHVLQSLRARGVPLAVASSSATDRLHLVLAATGISSFFDVVVSADDVIRAKPAPDPFLLAAQQLGYHPAACLAVEDSTPGVTAALAAGMPVAQILRGAAPIDGALHVETAWDLLALCGTETAA